MKTNFKFKTILWLTQTEAKVLKNGCQWFNALEWRLTFNGLLLLDNYKNVWLKLIQNYSNFYQGILKGKYHFTIDLLFDWFGLVCFANKNKNCQLPYIWFQTSETGGQQHSDTSPLSIPCFYSLTHVCNDEMKLVQSMFVEI